jgi:malonyl CoA-acyl carrier protein transacylase
MRQTAIVIFPGRGAYNKTELGYLTQHFPGPHNFLDVIDDYRIQQGFPAVTALDQSESFNPDLHTGGKNAPALIYACALADYQVIDRDKYDIVAVTGNSMGWYLALAAAGALDESGAIRVVNTMGSLTQSAGQGGQIVYPLMNTEWQRDSTLENTLDATIEEVSAHPQAKIYPSVMLGGMRVLAANDKGVELLMKKLPPVQDHYPMQLLHHPAFHSPLLGHIPALAMAELAMNVLLTQTIPLIDGRGHIWQPYATDIEALYQYTFRYQIQHPYDYSKAVDVAIKEFAPDRIIIPGPGTTLVGPTAQVLISQQWLGLTSRTAFRALQDTEPFILSMGLASQRRRVVSGQD